MFPSQERERRRGHDNKNLCEHFEEKRECNVENMSRHVSLGWMLDQRNYRETDITGCGAHYSSPGGARGQVEADYLIIFSSINITINTRDTNKQPPGAGWSRLLRKQSKCLPV